jgi:PTS system ascorbate-specific IIA component
MAQLLLVAHAPLASAMAEVARHAFPDCGAQLHAVDVQPAESPEAVEARLRQALGAGQVLILADTFGATPSNAALKVIDGERVRLVCGLNVPMLWRTLCYAHEPLESLVSRALQGGAQGVMQWAHPRPQNQFEKEALHDQGQRSNQ